MRPRRRLASVALAILALVPAGAVRANPQGAVVVGGSAQIVQTSPTRLDVNQSSSRAVIDWRSFSVGAGEQTNFAQPSASALAVNRVRGGDPSEIAGRITANGQVVLVNPNGIVFERGSQVDAAGFVATTSWIKRRDAMEGNLAFTRGSTAPTASVVNRGQITVKQGGLAALVAPGVVNDGVIRARLGRAALAAGDTFTIDLAGDRLVNFAVDAKGLRQVTAPDGTPLAAAITNSGTISANGGTVEITVDSAKGVVDRAINMTGIAEARTVRQQRGAIVLDAGEGGTVEVSGRLDAGGYRAGQIGGSIAVTGREVALQGAAVDASGQAGGGTIAVGGSWHGAGPVRNAARTSVDQKSLLRADATGAGQGGEVVVWSDVETRFLGRISARGGAAGGDGGNAEVSSHALLDFRGRADLRAPAGRAGTLLLDPNDVLIQADGTSTRPLIGTSILTVADLQQQLLFGNVVVTTGLPGIGTQLGNITVANDVFWSSGNSLTLSAYRDIMVNAKLSSTNGGSVILRADNTGTGTGTIDFGVGGAIAASGGARVSLYFNSNDNANNGTINTQTYSATQSYTGNVFLSDGATLTQYALVNTAFDLANINNNPAGTYALGRDIDASPIANFPMIGSFSGLLDGQNHTVDGLRIDSAAANVGLFSETLGGSTVRNLSLTNMAVNSTADSSNVGGLAGLLGGSAINTHSAGSVSAAPAANAVGGLIGQTNQTASGNGSVVQSSSSATVTGGLNAGGLVGGTNGGNSITQSSATGAVTTTGGAAGGLVGLNSGTIADSVATGAVTGNIAGGLIGVNAPPNPNDVGTVLATGPVKGTTFAGGLIGQALSTSNLHDSYWDQTATGQTEGAGSGQINLAKGLTTQELQSGILPSGFDPTIWRARAGFYPSLFGPAQSVSGNVFAGPGELPLAGATVNLLVDGSDTGLTSTTTAGGFYSFNLPGGTIPAGGKVLAVLTGGGSGNAFYDGAPGSLANLDVYAGGFLTVYSGAASLSAMAAGLHSAAGGSSPPQTVAKSLLFSPTTTTALQLNTGAGAWLNPTAGSFSLDLPIIGSDAAKLLLATGGTISQTAAGSIKADQLLLLGNDANYALSGTGDANQIGTLAASTGAVMFGNGNSLNPVDLATGSIFGVAGVQGTARVRISTSGNLTLAAGAPVMGSGSGTAVALVAGGAFTNKAGAAAISVGGGGRFLVYSQDPSNDDRGGLAYEFKQYNATPGSVVLGAGNGFLYSIAPTISLTGVSKTYDGTTALPTDAGGFTTSGGIDNDIVRLTGVSGNFDNKNAGTGKTVTVTGAASFSASDPTGAAVFGYQLAPLPAANTIGTITPAPLTVTATPNSKTYDGTTSAAAVPTITAGTLFTGDSATLSETYADRNAGTNKTLTPLAVIADGNGGGNYTVALVPSAAGTIAKAPLTVAASPDIKTYDGTTTSAATPSIAGLAATDSLTGLSQSFDSRNAGTRVLSVGGGLAVNDGNGGANYTLTTQIALGTITPAPLTVSATPDSKTYDGTTSAAALPTITAGTLFAGDSAALSESYADRNAGAGKILNPAATISDGNGGGNYALTLLSNPLGLIGAAPLAVVATDASRDFGQPNPALGGVVTGLVGGDTEAAIGLAYSTEATTASPAGSYPITAAIRSGNYLVNVTPGTLLVRPATAPTADQSTLILTSVEQASNEVRQTQDAAARTALFARGDVLSRIVQGFELKISAPREALFIVLPNADGTVGAISVDDGKSVTTLDRPYGAAELRQGELSATEITPDETGVVFGSTIVQRCANQQSGQALPADCRAVTQDLQASRRGRGRGGLGQGAAATRTRSRAAPGP